MAKRKCKVCGCVFEKPENRPFQDFCSIECGVKLGMERRRKAAIRAKAEAKRKERARTKALRHKLETIPELTKKAQAAFNRYIRLRDRGKPCISCGKPLGGEPNSYDAGHYRSVGSSPHLRFDENNVHGQCKHCNCHLSGNVVAYRQGLIERIGLPETERIEADQSEKHYSKQDLRELAATYRKKARELEKCNP